MRVRRLAFAAARPEPTPVHAFCQEGQSKKIEKCVIRVSIKVKKCGEINPIKEQWTGTNVVEEG